MNRWWALAAALMAASLLAEIVAHEGAHALSWWHALPAFDFAYGVAGCLVIILVSKALGKAWLQRPERYYEEDRR